jgi:hypothetical protein
MSKKLGSKLCRVARIIGFTLAIVMLFASPCLGGHENLLAGDYRISFDFNTTQDYVLTGGAIGWNADAIITNVSFKQSAICITGNSSVYQASLARRIGRWSAKPVAMISVVRQNFSTEDNDTYQLSKDFFGMGFLDRRD